MLRSRYARETRTQDLLHHEEKSRVTYQTVNRIWRRLVVRVNDGDLRDESSVACILSVPPNVLTIVKTGPTSVSASTPVGTTQRLVERVFRAYARSVAITTVQVLVARQ